MKNIKNIKTGGDSLKKQYQARFKNQIIYFLKPFLGVLFIMLVLYNGFFINYPGKWKHFYPLISFLLAFLVAAYKTYKLSYLIELDGTMLNIKNYFTGKEVLHMETEDYFIQPNFQPSKAIRAYQFQKINSDEDIIKINLTCCLNNQEYQEFLAIMSNSRIKTLPEQLSIDKDETYVIRPRSIYKVSDLWALGSAFIIPIIIVIINMLFKNRVDYKSLKTILIVLLVVFLLKGFRELWEKKDKKVLEVTIDKDEFRIKTQNQQDIFKWKDIKEIIITHPSVLNWESRILQIYDGKNHYQYHLGDTKYPRKEYALIYGLIYMHNRNKIGIFY